MDTKNPKCTLLSSFRIKVHQQTTMFHTPLPPHVHRNSKLKEQLQALKKKEEEETKALEDIVAKVEENLVTSTVSVYTIHPEHTSCTRLI